MARLADGVDLLIHEALDAAQVREGLLTWNASAESVGALADDASIGRLVLTHLLPPPDTNEAEQAFVDQAIAGGYNGPITVAADLHRIRLS
jgi:ribonuclease Z